MRTGADQVLAPPHPLLADAKTAVSPERTAALVHLLSQPSAAVPPLDRVDRVPLTRFQFHALLRLSSPSEDLLAGSERSATSAPAPPLGIQGEPYPDCLSRLEACRDPADSAAQAAAPAAGTGCGMETALHIGSSSSFNSIARFVARSLLRRRSSKWLILFRSVSMVSNFGFGIQTKCQLLYLSVVWLLSGAAACFLKTLMAVVLHSIV